MKPTALVLSAEQLRTLRHMLGINEPSMRVPKPYRDYYCANPGDPKLVALRDAGAVVMYRSDGYEWWTCTAAGRTAALISHRTIRWSKSKRVYSTFLDVRDALGDLTFKEFLTHGQFEQTRRSA